MAKESLLERGVIASAAGLLALSSALLLSCSSQAPTPSRQSPQPRANTSYPNQPQQPQTSSRSSGYEHPDFATVAVNPEIFSGQKIELTGYWVETSSGVLHLGYGYGSKGIRTDMSSDMSPALASRYNGLRCSPPLSPLNPRRGDYTTTIRGTMRNERLRVDGGYITGPDGTVYEF